MEKDINMQEDLVILDELGNEIVVGLEVIIPALLAWEYGAFVEDAHDFTKNMEINSGKDRKNTIR